MLHFTGSYQSHSDVDNISVPTNMSGEVVQHSSHQNTKKIHNIHNMPAHYQQHYPPSQDLPQQRPLNMTASNPYVNFATQRSDLSFMREFSYFNHTTNGMMPINLNAHRNQMYGDSFIHRNMLANLEVDRHFENPILPCNYTSSFHSQHNSVDIQAKDYSDELRKSSHTIEHPSFENELETFDKNPEEINNKVKNQVEIDYIEINKVADEPKNLSEKHIEMNINKEKRRRKRKKPNKTIDIREKTIDNQEKTNDNQIKLGNDIGEQTNERLVLKIKKSKPEKVVKTPVNQLDEIKLGLNLEEDAFLNDSNGFSMDYYKKYYKVELFTIIDAEKSEEMAMDICKLGIYKDKTKLNKIYQCSDCVLLFRHPKRFLIHKAWHSFGRLNQNLQQKSLEMGKQAKKIQRTKHCSDDYAETCEICQESYGSKKKLRLHKARVHPTSDPLQCPVCHKMFSNASYLRNHTTTHSEERKFMCDECPKTFKFLHSLLRHQPTHKEKIFPCQSCDKKFGSELLLNIHLKTHEKFARGTTFHCTYCAKGFYHSYNLAIHERTHRGERPYKCEICDGSYSTNSSLKRHLKVSHSKMKPCECSICHRCFSTEPIRDRHVARAHSEVT